MRQEWNNDRDQVSPAADLCDYLVNTADDLGVIDPRTVAVAAAYITLAAGGLTQFVEAVETHGSEITESWRRRAIAQAEADIYGADAAEHTTLSLVAANLTYYPDVMTVDVYEYLTTI